MNTPRKIILGLWLAVLTVALGYYITHRAQFSPEQLADFFRRHESWFLALFLFFSVARAFVLLPSTPLVVAGALLIPESPWIVLGISLLGIALASTLIYFFADWLGFRSCFAEAGKHRIDRIEKCLRHPLGGVFVAGWAFFPVMPTDLVCYVAGAVRMPFARFLGAILLGESIICALYIFGGGWLSRAVL